MRFLRRIFDYLAIILIVGGLVVIGFTYTTKKEILNALVSNTIVKSSMSVLKTIAFAIGAIFLGLICLAIASKLASVVRKNEREKREALRAQEKENKELQKQLKKEAEEAKKEAEKAKKEAEKLKETLHMEEEKEKEAEATE